MTDLRDNLKAWKDSGTNLSFTDWKVQHGITQTPIIDNTLPQNEVVVKPKKHNSIGKEIHIWLDDRVHEKLKGETISGQINRIMGLWFGIPQDRYSIEECDRKEVESGKDKQRLEQIKQNERQPEVE